MCIYDNMYIQRSWKSLIALIIISAHMYNQYIVLPFSFKHLYNVYILDFNPKHIILEKHICTSLLENINVEKIKNKTKK